MTEPEEMVSVPKAELESLRATIETLGNEEVMAQLRRSEEDIEEGRVRPVKELLEEL
ncbi:MAG: hypothetical protein SVU88_00295 [Candidatus Nanohaloarchaea archaeon]|nr:hypothetical protein [Candidatus Nanohaloarchaea archaeon]